jgi:uncharacterized protein
LYAIQLFMLEFLQNYPLSPFQWTVAILSAVFVGVGKSGLNSISIITVTTFAWVFGSKISTGILLPMLIVGDVLAVLYYKRTVHWQSFWRLLPWVIFGILVAVWVGKDLDETVFKTLMASIVLITVIGLFWLEYRPLKQVSHGFSAVLGMATGFTTMVGNQANGFSTVYFMSMRFSKNQFIGTNAWLFLFINIFKLPFHIFSWQTINSESLSINLCLVPFLIVGFYLGRVIVKKIDEKQYRQIILWLTAAAALFVFVK